MCCIVWKIRHLEGGELGWHPCSRPRSLRAPVPGLGRKCELHVVECTVCAGSAPARGYSDGGLAPLITVPVVVTICTEPGEKTVECMMAACTLFGSSIFLQTSQEGEVSNCTRCVPNLAKCQLALHGEGLGRGAGNKVDGLLNVECLCGCVFTRRSRGSCLWAKKCWVCVICFSGRPVQPVGQQGLSCDRS